MLGKPKFKENQTVNFTFNSKTKTGVIYIIDAYGTFFDNSDVSYDIFVKDERMLYKHIREDKISHA